MKLTSFVLCLLSLAGCANLNDYLITEVQTQTIPSYYITKVTLKCYCSGNIKVTNSEYEFIEAKITGVLGSTGYHGQQETPSSIPQKSLEFSMEQKGSELILSSKESKYLHDAFLIKELTISVPPHIPIEIQQIPYYKLEESHF